MDLGFSRRQQANRAAFRQDINLASLLASLATRQALSPTAQRFAEVCDTRLDQASHHSQADLFAAGVSRNGQAASLAGSFSPTAANLLVTGEKHK